MGAIARFFAPFRQRGKVNLVQDRGTGTPEQQETWLKPLREFGRPVVNEIGPMPYVKIQSKDDALYPRGGLYYLKSGYVSHLNDADIIRFLNMNDMVAVLLESVIMTDDEDLVQTANGVQAE